MDNDEEAEIIRLIREANAKRRGYADFDQWPPNRELEERGIVWELCRVLEEAGQPLARGNSVIVRGRGNDPPDCEATTAEGKRLAIEVTELVDQSAIEAARLRARYEWAQWDSPKLIAAIKGRLARKDSIKDLKDGPYDAYIVVMNTDEPELTIERIRSLIGDFRFPKPEKIKRVFILLSYDPALKTRPFLELVFADE